MKKGARERIKRHIMGVVCVLFLIAAGVVTEAAGSYEINGVTVAFTDFYSSPSECWTYANRLYQKIWGKEFNSYFTDEENLLRYLKDEELTLTEEHLKKYISMAPLGACLRISPASYLHQNSDWSGHSQILVQKDANGFAVLEGGLYAWPYCREKYYTWNEYITTSWLGGHYGYIKYLKWPGATPIISEISNDPIGCVDICQEEGEELRVKGWAADWDLPEKSVKLRVVIRDPRTGKEVEYTETANSSRKDVNRIHEGLGTNHGFDIYLPVPEETVYTVDVYAVNLEGGVDILIDHEDMERILETPEPEEEVETPEETESAIEEPAEENAAEDIPDSSPENADNTADTSDTEAAADAVEENSNPVDPAVENDILEWSE